MAKKTEKIENSTTENVAETSVEVSATDEAAGTNESDAETAEKSATLSNDDMVQVKSLTANITYTCPRTHDSFYWSEVGDIEEMTFAQLKIMRNQHPRFFTDKWLKPMSDIAIDKLKLKGIYELDFDIRRDMRTFYGDDVEAAKEKLSAITESQREAVIAEVTSAVKQGKITNVKIIRLIESVLNISLMDLV